MHANSADHCSLASMKTGRTYGFSRLEVLVSTILIGIVATLLLNRLTYYQEVAEKANVEYTISMLKSALRVQMATMMVEGRVRDYVLLERQNPMDWLEEKPRNYSLGAPTPDGVCTGCWSYDPDTGMLTYRPARGKYLRLDRSGHKRIRLQVKMLRDLAASEVDARGEKPVIRISLELVEPYYWLP